ncbi:MAG TPA: dockerin type I domain-containing protein [Isosphaeraceae bacterium]|jgi:hypothetical protein|nr:dockerin type I domain-containing protein [Isosphaeraceae bacterium]
MPPSRKSCRPLVEGLEGRLALSGGLAGSAIGIGQAVVSAPGQVVGVGATVAPQNLTPVHRTTVLGIVAAPTAGSSLAPKIVGATGPNGKRLPLQLRAGFSPPHNGQANAFTQVGQPGTLTTLATGKSGTTGGVSVLTSLPGDVNGDGVVNFQDQQAFAAAWLTHIGDGFYNPNADLNHNGFVGLDDAKLLARNFATPGQPVPLNVVTYLAPGDGVKHRVPEKNSGGLTFKSDITIVGRTTPGSSVVSDSGLGDYTFTGPFLPTNPQGYFFLHAKLTGALTNFEFLIIDPWGRQIIHAFPILRLGPGI